jgi:hypothetical protein
MTAKPKRKAQKRRLQIPLKAKERPATLYRAGYADVACNMVSRGCTRGDMAAAFGVDINTFAEWIDRHPALKDAIALGKDEASARVEHKLYERATGYSHPAVKIFCSKDGDVTQVPYTEHFPPDTAAASLWLRNKRPDEWRDKQDVNLTGDLGAEIVKRLENGRKRLTRAS